MRLAAVRYTRDRVRATQPGAPFTFARDGANDACDFIEKLPHVEGKWATENIVLHDAHVFFVVNLFGFRNLDGDRRFTTALLSIARKNAKSLLGAAILLYCLCCENEPGAQVISAATTGSQARIVFNAAKKMVDKTPDLREAFGVETFANSIVNWTDMASFKPINAKASTQDGLNPSHTCLDEIHAHKTADLLNVLKSAAGARANPLWLYTTTEGFETPGPWPELRKFAQQVLDNVIQADHFFGLIFSLDEQDGKPGEPGYMQADDDFDSTKWVKANPLMEVNPLLMREIEKLAMEAKQMPSAHGEFRIKRLNRPASAANTWVNLTKWRMCEGEPNLEFLEGKPCYAGLDGAATTDIMAFRLVWEVDGRVYTWGRRWVPRNAVNSRSERGTVPYAGWVRAGLLTECGDSVLDYETIRAEIVALMRRFGVRKVAYDSWNLRDMIGRLKKDFPDTHVTASKVESTFVEFRQGPKSFNPAMKATESLYLENRLVHGHDGVLNWCISNVVPRYDENMNMAPSRQRSGDKIDDAVALFMAIGALRENSEEGRKFQLFFV